LLVSSYALAAPPKVECDPEWPAHCSVSLSAKTRAPFSGQLLTSELAISLGQKAAWSQKQIDLAVAKTSSIAAVKLQTEKRIHRIELDAKDEKIDRWKTRAGEEKARAEKLRMKWYESPAFVIPVTVVATIGVIWATKEVMQVTLVDSK
jgi:hypothetical protein